MYFCHNMKDFSKINVKAKVSDHNMPNSVFICLSKTIREIINGREVVCKEVNDEIWIREASLLDERRLTINKTNCITYTSPNAKDLIGEYNYSVDGDFIILFK